MKLAEAILERQNLEDRVDLLKSRIEHDLEMGRSTSHLQEELQRTANQARDISIAIAWTEQSSSMSGLPLGSFRIRIDIMSDLARYFEGVNRDKADEYWASVVNDKRIFEAATWLVDLKIPGVENKEGS